MKIKLILIISIFTSWICATSLTANDYLEKVMNRTEGLNHSFELKILKNQKGKPTKERILKIWAYWPKIGEHSRLSFVETLSPNNLSDVKYWEHRFKNGTDAKRWMTMPVTGKLKDVSDKKPNKNEFDFSELEITPELINDHKNSILSSESYMNRDVVVVESKKTTGKKTSKKLWIDAKEFFVLKAEFYTKSGRKSKTIEMGELSRINEMTFPQKIYVNDIRKKTTYEVSISKIQIIDDIDESLFAPSEAKK